MLLFLNSLEDKKKWVSDVCSMQFKTCFGAKFGEERCVELLCIVAERFENCLNCGHSWLTM